MRNWDRYLTSKAQLPAATQRTRRSYGQVHQRDNDKQEPCEGSEVNVQTALAGAVSTGVASDKWQEAYFQMTSSVYTWPNKQTHVLSGSAVWPDSPVFLQLYWPVIHRAWKMLPGFPCSGNCFPQLLLKNSPIQWRPHLKLTAQKDQWTLLLNLHGCLSKHKVQSVLLTHSKTFPYLHLPSTE